MNHDRIRSIAVFGDTMMEWEFKQERGETNRWRWKCVAEGTRETLRMSQLPFKTLEECVRDAEKYGYVATSPTAS